MVKVQWSIAQGAEQTSEKAIKLTKLLNFEFFTENITRLFNRS